MHRSSSEPLGSELAPDARKRERRQRLAGSSCRTWAEPGRGGGWRRGWQHLERRRLRRVGGRRGYRHRSAAAQGPARHRWNLGVGHLL